MHSYQQWHSYDCVQWGELEDSNLLLKYYGILNEIFLNASMDNYDTSSVENSIAHMTVKTLF